MDGGKEAWMTTIIKVSIEEGGVSGEEIAGLLERSGGILDEIRCLYSSMKSCWEMISCYTNGLQL
jgi:hypothetical protein